MCRQPRESRPRRHQRLRLITSNTTWTSAGNNYVVTCDTSVASGVTLTIQPGVVVKFEPGASLRIDGTLVARGCTFTSNNAIPAKGDWGRIYFSTASVDASFDASGNYVSGSIIQGCTLEWGGGGTGIRAMLETNLASPLIDDNNIQNSWTSGIYALWPIEFQTGGYPPERDQP